MSDQLDRPARRPRGPRPAADAAVDPIDYRAAPRQRPTEAPLEPISNPSPSAPTNTTQKVNVTASALPEPITGSTRDLTVQFNQRMSLQVANVFDEAAKRFPTKRAAIEFAILSTFGTQKDDSGD